MCGPGRGGPLGQLGYAGHLGLGMQGWQGVGAETQLPVAAEAVQEGTGTDCQPSLREPPSCPGQLRPHTTQHVQRAPTKAGTGTRGGAGLGVAEAQLLLAGRGGIFLVLVLGWVLGSGLWVFGCSRRRH